MKANGSMLGGSMRRAYMPSYANYFVKFLQGYESEGVPVQAVTVQNEVDTDQDGRMPACIWPQEYEADFVRRNLGPAFQSNGIKTQIWLVDHNYNLWGRAIGELETPDVQTADFAYLRLRKQEYSAKERKALEQRIARLGGSGDAYIYFKHEDTPEGALHAENVLSAAKG